LLRGIVLLKIRAETLAGKGTFNSETTRALHLKKNPLGDAINERHEKEVTTLKATIERQRLQLECNPAAAALVPQRPEGKCSCGFDEKKLNQRLKESFKEQIGFFREGVYLMTGESFIKICHFLHFGKSRPP
jgi:hypothetical protein